MRPLFETSFGDGLFIVRVSLICRPAATLGSPKIDLAALCNGRRAPSQAKHPTPTTTIYLARRSRVREPNRVWETLKAVMWDGGGLRLSVLSAGSTAGRALGIELASTDALAACVAFVRGLTFVLT